MQLVISQVRKWVLNRKLGAKTSWGCSISEILLPINSRLICLYDFTPAEIMLGFVPKSKITKIHKDTTEVTPGVIEEASQEDVDVMEEGPDGLRIEKLVNRRKK